MPRVRCAEKQLPQVGGSEQSQGLSCWGGLHRKEPTPKPALRGSSAGALPVAVDLKYLTALWAGMAADGEEFHLKNQSAQDVISYDCVRDWSRRAARARCRRRLKMRP